jgi:hypothetical protein
MESKNNKIILIVIACGFWAIVLQNMGIIPTAQNVEVVNSVDVGGTVEVGNTVNVNGYVDVGEVDVNISKVNGYNTFYNRGGNDKRYNRIPVYIGDN